MAFLRDCTRDCNRCGRVARYELLTFRNETHGFYCGRCSTVVLREVKASEKRYFEHMSNRDA